MEHLDYRKKLGIGFCDKEKNEYFLVRMRNHISILDNNINQPELEDDIVFRYCNITGTDYAYIDSSFEGIIDDIYDEKDFLSFVAKYVSLMNLLMEVKGNISKQLKDILLENLSAASIPYSLIEDSDGCFVFPKGAKEMDNALVSEPLEWLSAYPKTHTAFVKALIEYTNAKAGNASDIADKFRKTLETFLREFFGNSAPLEKNKVEYGRYLKSIGVPAEITGNMETLLQAYANFMNGYAKHQDATSMNVLEYIMYQTGNIIRLLITLKQEETGNAD